MQFSIHSIALVFICISVYTDVRDGKIYNAVTFPMMGIGLAVSFAESEEHGFLQVGILLLLFAFGQLRLLGMGDLKLLMGIAAMTGIERMLFTIVFASLMLIVTDLVRNRKAAVQDLKAGIQTLLLRKVDRSLGTGRKIKFAQFLLFGYIIGGMMK